MVNTQTTKFGYSQRNLVSFYFAGFFTLGLFLPSSAITAESRPSIPSVSRVVRSSTSAPANSSQGALIADPSATGVGDRSKTLFGNVDLLSLPREAPLNSQHQLRIIDDTPLPEEIIKAYFEPLVWVKIPKTFAGVWETRNDYTYDHLVDSAEEIPIIKRSILQNSCAWRANNDCKFRNQFHELNDQYMFIRGMQVDEDGNIWDCPSLRNIEVHTVNRFDGSFKKTWLFVISGRKFVVVSDRMISESFTSSFSQGFGNTVTERLKIIHVSADHSQSANGSQVDDFLPQARLKEVDDLSPCFSRENNYFDPDGCLPSEYVPEYKIAEFKPLDSWRGINLKSSFEEFRKSKTLVFNSPVSNAASVDDLANSGETAPRGVESNAPSSTCDQQGWLQLMSPRNLFPLGGTPCIYIEQRKR